MDAPEPENQPGNSLTGVLDLTEAPRGVRLTSVPIILRSQPLDEIPPHRAHEAATLWHCAPTRLREQISWQGLRADCTLQTTRALGQPAAVYGWSSQRSAAVCAAVHAVGEPTDVWRLLVRAGDLQPDRLLDDAWIHAADVPAGQIVLAAAGIDKFGADDFWDNYAETAGGRRMPPPFDPIR
jgi:hypothetical protein